MSKRPHTGAGKVVCKKRKNGSGSGLKVPTDHIAVWRFGENEFFASVKKTWDVSHCIAYLTNKIEEADRQECYDLDLWVKNRRTMLERNKSLSDYPGLTKLFIVQRPKSRDPPSKYQTEDDDVIDPDSDDICVRMVCGHAISPDNLYRYSWNAINNGAIQVTCPAIPEEDKPHEQCSSVWSFKSISSRACLSNDEMNLFQTVLFSNWLEKHTNVYLCPNCDEALEDTCGRSVVKCHYCITSFCVTCSGNVVGSKKTCINTECKQSIPKVRSLLRKCPVRTIVGVPNCPSVRACPKCQCVIEYGEEDSCKHMTCSRNTCQANFCFICLKVKTDRYYWPCGGAFDQCSPSPRQNI